MKLSDREPCPRALGDEVLRPPGNQPREHPTDLRKTTYGEVVMMVQKRPRWKRKPVTMPPASAAEWNSEEKAAGPDENSFEVVLPPQSGPPSPGMDVRRVDRALEVAPAERTLRAPTAETIATGKRIVALKR